MNWDDEREEDELYREAYDEDYARDLDDVEVSEEDYDAQRRVA